MHMHAVPLIPVCPLKTAAGTITGAVWGYRLYKKHKQGAVCLFKCLVWKRCWKLLLNKLAIVPAAIKPARGIMWFHNSSNNIIQTIRLNYELPYIDSVVLQIDKHKGKESQRLYFVISPFFNVTGVYHHCFCLLQQFCTYPSLLMN